MRNSRSQCLLEGSSQTLARNGRFSLIAACTGARPHPEFARRAGPPSSYPLLIPPVYTICRGSKEGSIPDAGGVRKVPYSPCHM